MVILAGISKNAAYYYTSKLLPGRYRGGYRYSKLLDYCDSMRCTHDPPIINEARASLESPICRSVSPKLPQADNISKSFVSSSSGIYLNAFAMKTTNDVTHNPWRRRVDWINFTGLGTRSYRRTPSLYSDSNSSPDPSQAWLKDGKTYNKGPDQILPSTAPFTWHANGAVRIKMEGNEMASHRPISVPSLLKSCAERSPNKVALAIKRDEKWLQWTYENYIRDVRTAAKAFIALGLERFHSVCILGFNAPEWLISDMASIFAGGFAAGIYTTNSPEACAYCAVDSQANIFVVEDEVQLAKVLGIRSQLPHLKAIIQYSGEPTVKGVLSWSQFMALGNQQSDAALEERLRQIAINQTCTLIYTSGTTGNPKGVMLTHDNLTWMSHVNQRWGNFLEATDTYQETVVSFLPLSHVAAQMADIYCGLAVCGRVCFPDKDALKGTLVENMKEILPTKFLAVPFVWEKMYEKIAEVGAQTTGIKRKIAIWAKDQSLQHNMRLMNGIDEPTLGYKIAKAVVLSKVRDALGLTKSTLNLSGAAPISPDIIQFFMALDIIITEAYGLSECSGPHTLGTADSFRIGSVGRTMTGCKTKILEPNADGIGEVLLGGRHIFIGYLRGKYLRYLNLPLKTKKALDPEGWMHTEDMGRFDKDGYLYITGRLKEIIITAGGENVAPVPIEDRVKNEMPAVSQAVVLGEKLKFLSVLLTLKTEIDPITQVPLDMLTRGCKEWVETNGGCTVSTVQDVLKELNEKNNQKLRNAFDEALERVNTQAISHAQRVQKWVILPTQFSVPGGEIGPTLKLKRRIVYEKYKATIEKLYEV